MLELRSFQLAGCKNLLAGLIKTLLSPKGQSIYAYHFLTSIDTSVCSITTRQKLSNSIIVSASICFFKSGTC